MALPSWASPKLKPALTPHPCPDARLQLPECTTAFCAACQPAEALEDESKETKDEVCTECQADHVLSDDGEPPLLACLAALPAGPALAASRSKVPA